MEKKTVWTKKEYLGVIEFIKKYHTGFRKFTLSPYWVHPICVAQLVMKYKNSHCIDELVIAALCHDLVEDTEITVGILESMFGKLVASLDLELTSDKDFSNILGKHVYLALKMEFMSSWALVIKLCDRLHNVMDFAFSSTDFINKYSKETLYILRHIELTRDLSITHRLIIADIRKYVGLYYTEESIAS